MLLIYSKFIPKVVFSIPCVLQVQVFPKLEKNIFMLFQFIMNSSYRSSIVMYLVVENVHAKPIFFKVLYSCFCFTDLKIVVLLYHKHR